MLQTEKKLKLDFCLFKIINYTTQKYVIKEIQVKKSK